MKRMKILLILLAAILLVIIGKMVWVAVMTRHLGSFESERTDILSASSIQRRPCGSEISSSCCWMPG